MWKPRVPVYPKPSVSQHAILLQGQWEKQPLPSITKTLREPKPHCPLTPEPRPAVPVPINLGHFRRG